MGDLLDYSAGVPSARAIKQAGYSGVIRYVSPPRESWMKGKPLTRSEVDALKREGLEIVSVYQNRKEDWRRGGAGGAQDAGEAIKIHRAAGGPEKCVIYSAIDSNPSLNEWNGIAVNYVREFRRVLHENGFRLGIYCNTLVHAWAEEDKIPHYWWAHNWGSDNTTSKAQIHQYVIDKHSVDGVGVDLNRPHVPDYGQWSKAGVDNAYSPKPPGRAVAPNGLRPHPEHRGDPLFLPEVLRAFGLKVVESQGWREWGMGDFGAIWGVVAHHTGANNTSANFVKFNPMLDNGLSSQLHLAKDGTVTVLGAGIAYHAGLGSYPGLPTNDANRLTIGIEAVSDGQGWSSQQLDAYYRTVAAILWYLGKDSSHVIAHHEWAGRAQGKWDPGLNGSPMPMNPFRQKVQHYIDNPPFKAANNEEDDMRADERKALFDLVNKVNKLEQKINRIDKETRITGDQLNGFKRNKDGFANFVGWEQLGNRTLINAVAAIGEVLKVNGMVDIKEQDDDEEKAEK